MRFFGKFVRGKGFAALFALFSMFSVCYVSERMGRLLECFFSCSCKWWIFAVLFVFMGYMLSLIHISEIFKKLKTKLDQEISEKRNAEILQKYYMESLPLLQVNFYSTLIEGKLGEEEIPKYLSDYQISFTGPYYCCLVIHTSLSQNEDHMSPQLLITSEMCIRDRLPHRQEIWWLWYTATTVLPI